MKKTIIYIAILYVCLILLLSNHLAIIPESSAETPILLVCCLTVTAIYMWLIHFKEKPTSAESKLHTKTITASLILFMPGLLVIGWAVSKVYFINAGLLAGAIHKPYSISAKCIKSYKGHRRIISIFTLENGQSWEVQGQYICPAKTKECILDVSSGFFAHRIKSISCKGS